MSKHLRLARLMELMLLVKQHPDWGAKRLAKYFEISEKRLYDDINELNAAKIPIYFNGKGYSFLTPQTLPSVNLNWEEALALFVGATVMEGRFGNTYAAAVRSAGTKLLELLPKETRQGLLGLSGRIAVEPKGRTGDRALRLIHTAMTQKNTLLFSYNAYSSGAVTSREAAPYAVIFRGNSWYLIGYCMLRKEIRTFRVNRIGDIALTGNPFEYPQDFSLAGHLDKSWQIFQGEETEVTVRFSPEIAPLISEHQWQPDQRLIKQKNGGVTFTATVKGTLEIRRWILSWGEHAEVLALNLFARK